MTSKDKDQIFLDQSKHLLDKNAEQLDAETRAQLRQIRQQALSAKPKPWLFSTPYPAFAATTAVLVLTLGLWLYQSPDTLDASLEDLPLLTATDDLEFYQDIEFYDWLEHEQQKS